MLVMGILHQYKIQVIITQHSLLTHTRISLNLSTAPSIGMERQRVHKQRFKHVHEHEALLWMQHAQNLLFI